MTPLRIARLLLLLWPMAATAHADCALPGYSPGETFSFRLFLGAIEGGRARLAFSRPVAGTPPAKSGPVVAVGQIETLPWLALVAKLRDDYRVLFDPRTMLTREAHSVERGRAGTVERELTTRFTGNRATQLLTTPTAHTIERALPAPTRDPLAALMVLRASPLDEGATLSLLVLDRARLWRTHMTAHRERFVPHPSGGSGAAKPAVSAIRLDGENVQADVPPARRLVRHFRLWLSDDARRVLLRMEADTDLGTGAVELSSYVPGDRAATCPALPLPGVD